jgi:hypothetical protein
MGMAAEIAEILPDREGYRLFCVGKPGWRVNPMARGYKT